MVPAIIGLILLLVLIVIAIRLISLKRPPVEESGSENINASGPIIHASGIYSIVRKSPRDDLLRILPQETEIRKYISSINEDIYGRAISNGDKELLLKKWLNSIEDNIAIVEKGDSANVEFYYLESPGGKHCPVCANFFKQGQFVMRQEIFKTPSVIPPLHLGCTTRLIPYLGKENLRETNIIRMLPLFNHGVAPTLPDWKQTVAT